MIGSRWTAGSARRGPARCPNGSHINVVLARRGSPTAAAAARRARRPAPRARCRSSPASRPGTVVRPATIVVNKSTIEGERARPRSPGARRSSASPRACSTPSPTGCSTRPRRPRSSCSSPSGSTRPPHDETARAAREPRGDARRRSPTRSRRRRRRTSGRSPRAARTRANAYYSGELSRADRRGRGRAATRSRSTRRSAPPGIRCRARAVEATLVIVRSDDGLGGLRERRRRCPTPRCSSGCWSGSTRAGRRSCASSARPSTSTAGGRGRPRSRSGTSSRRALGEPLWRLLGGRSERILAYASSGELVEPEERARRVVALRDARRAGGQAPLPPAPTGATDVEVVERGARRGRRRRRADGRRQPGLADGRATAAPRWDVADGDAVRARARAARRLLARGAAAAPTTSTATRALRRRTSLRIAAGEMVRSLPEARDLVLRGGVDVIQPDVVLAGGLGGCRRIAALADLCGRTFSPHTWSNGLGLLANLHLALAVSTCPYIEVPLDPPALDAGAARLAARRRRGRDRPRRHDRAAAGPGPRRDARPRRARGAPGRMRIRAAVLHATGTPLEVERARARAARAPARCSCASPPPASATPTCTSPTATSATGAHPIVLGHEGAGVVEAVGDGRRRTSRPGDAGRVLLRARLRRAAAPARRGGATCARRPPPPPGPGTLLDGTSRLRFADGAPVQHFNFVSCFAERCVVPGRVGRAAPAGAAAVAGGAARLRRRHRASARSRNAARVAVGRDASASSAAAASGSSSSRPRGSPAPAAIIAVDRDAREARAGARARRDATRSPPARRRRRRGARARARRRRPRVRGGRLAGDDPARLGRAAPGRDGDRRRHRAGRASRSRCPRSSCCPRRASAAATTAPATRRPCSASMARARRRGPLPGRRRRLARDRPRRHRGRVRRGCARGRGRAHGGRDRCRSRRAGPRPTRGDRLTAADDRPLERRVTDAVARRRDDLCDLLCDLVAFDTRAPDPDSAPRDEAALQELRGRPACARPASPCACGSRRPADLPPSRYPIPAGTTSAAGRSCSRPPRARAAAARCSSTATSTSSPSSRASCWTSDPFAPALRDGRLYGRGACDMKGGVAAMLLATEVLRALEVPLAGDLVVNTVTDEESTAAGSLAVAASGLRADGGDHPRADAPRGLAGHARLADARDHRRRPRGPRRARAGALERGRRRSTRSRRCSRARGAAARCARSGSCARTRSTRCSARPGIVPTGIGSGQWMVSYPAACTLSSATSSTCPPRPTPTATARAWRRRSRRACCAAAEADPWLAAHPPRFTWPGDVPPGFVRAGRAGRRRRRSTRWPRSACRADVASRTTLFDGPTFSRAGIPTIAFGPGDIAPRARRRRVRAGRRARPRGAGARRGGDAVLRGGRMTRRTARRAVPGR